MSDIQEVIREKDNVIRTLQAEVEMLSEPNQYLSKLTSLNPEQHKLVHVVKLREGYRKYQEAYQKANGTTFNQKSFTEWRLTEI